MKLHFPIPSPYTAGIYPTVGSYDISDPEPANWRLKVLVESATNFWVYAVCSGRLSAVPPWELVESGIAPLHKPDHTFPDTISLYLEPNRVFPPPVGSPESLRIGDSLAQAGLGNTVRCYVYKNIDPTLFSAPITQQLGGKGAFGKYPIISPTERSEMFAKGRVSIWIKEGDALARASAHNASAAGRFMAEFGVMTTTGLVDPAYFFDTLQPYLSDPPQYSAFKTLIAPNWLAPRPPNSFLPATTAAAAVTSAQQRLYPAPALYEAKQRLSLTDGDWRTIGTGQKNLYWDRLLRSSGHAATGKPFAFDTDDMANPFQLEAVAEFFIGWPEPATGTVPALSAPQPSLVDLQQEDWNLVFIDPFHHPYLGNPRLPMPDYFLAKHTPPNATRCGTTVLPGPFNADAYDAVLFLVHHGEIKAWYRWSTYSCHKWEGEITKTKHKITTPLHLECNLASSVAGNKRYYFRSLTADSDFINYGFLLSGVSGGNSVPGRFYFRDSTPKDLGNAQSGDTAQGKADVMIHHGQSATMKNTTQSYNASGGCLVSPQFCRLRNTMVELYWEDELKKPATSRDDNLLFLSNRDHNQSQEIHSGNKLITGKSRYLAKYWDSKIKGACYVIRPDEPTQK